nr:MAG TPA: hypothetical protein [Caudoviricetes sp.]
MRNCYSFLFCEITKKTALNLGQSLIDCFIILQVESGCKQLY